MACGADGATRVTVLTRTVLPASRMARTVVRPGSPFPCTLSPCHRPVSGTSAGPVWRIRTLFSQVVDVSIPELSFRLLTDKTRAVGLAPMEDWHIM